MRVAAILLLAVPVSIAEAGAPSGEGTHAAAGASILLRSTVLVADFQGSEPAFEGVARAISARLREILAASGEVDVIPVDGRLVLDGAPVGEVLGRCAGAEDEACLHDLAAAVGADLLVLGTVSAPALPIDLTIARVDGDLVIASTASVPGGRLVGFVLDAARATARAQARREARTRGAPAAPEDPGGGIAPVASGEVTPRRWDPPRAPPTDLELAAAFRRREVIVTPWQEVGLRRAEYAAWRRSGDDLAEWKRARAGHRSQVLLGIAFGHGWGATTLRSYGVHATAADEPVVLDAYGFQAVDDGDGARIEGTVGGGLTRHLDLEYAATAAWVTVSARRESGKVSADTPGAVDATWRDEDGWESQRVPCVAHALRLRVHPAAHSGRGPVGLRPSLAAGFGAMPYPEVDPSGEGSRHLRFAPYVLPFVHIDATLAWDVGPSFSFLLRGAVWVDVAPDAYRRQVAEAGSQPGLLAGAFPAETGEGGGIEELPDVGRLSGTVVLGLQVRPNPPAFPAAGGGRARVGGVRRDDEGWLR